MASIQAMFASEVVDKATVLGARDERSADPAVADSNNMAVMSDCAVLWPTL